MNGRADVTLPPVQPAHQCEVCGGEPGRWFPFVYGWSTKHAGELDTSTRLVSKRWVQQGTAGGWVGDGCIDRVIDKKRRADLSVNLMFSAGLAVIMTAVLVLVVIQRNVLLLVFLMVPALYGVYLLHHDRKSMLAVQAVAPSPAERYAVGEDLAIRQHRRELAAQGFTLVATQAQWDAGPLVTPRE